MTAGRNPLIFIFVTRIIDAIGFGIVMPVLPQLLLSMGAPNVASAASTAGWMLATYAILQFVCGPLIGNLSDRFGRRPVILLSLLAYGFDYVLTGFAPSIGWLFLGRAVAGIAGAVYVPANAFVADVTPPEQRARAFGLVGSAFGFGFIIGPGIGGLLGELGPRAPFFAAGGLAILNFLFGIFVLPESLPLERRRTFSWVRANPLGAAMAFQKHPSIFVYALVVMISFIATNVYPSTWSFFTSARFGWSSGMIGLSLVATGVTMAAMQAGLVGVAVKRFGESRTAIGGLAIAAAGALAYAFIPDAWMIFVITVLASPQAVTYPSLQCAAFEASATERSGRAARSDGFGDEPREYHRTLCYDSVIRVFHGAERSHVLSRRRVHRCRRAQRRWVSGADHPTFAFRSARACARVATGVRRRL